MLFDIEFLLKIFGSYRNSAYLCIRNERKHSYGTKYGKKNIRNKGMTQEELRAKLESYDLKSLTIQRLLVVRDIKRNEQVKIQRFCNELRDYNSVGVLDISNDVRDRIDDCLQAVAADVDIYEAFVSRASEEIYKRIDE